ncbi:hypothetical protein DOS67_01440 [Staphylococcus felis]|nr:hypothetical protein DOS67_01440 [Staphylococcus felis]REI03631.1 hypothetical protein DOS62_07875 [Staphylococcus felis]REI34392.1 hypothetical protein DOS82_03200 [Staphylococcus felis]
MTCISRRIVGETSEGKDERRDRGSTHPLGNASQTIRIISTLLFWDLCHNLFDKEVLLILSKILEGDTFICFNVTIKVTKGRDDGCEFSI